MKRIDELKDQAPLWSALCRQADRVSFHMPAHRQGRAFSREWIDSLARCDTTELERTGDLADPAEHVRQAYDFAAATFGAGETWFITTGTTTAIRIMLAGALREGDEIIIPRAVHMAGVHAVAVLGLTPRFVMPVDGRPFEDGQPDTASFLAAMRDHPEAKAVYVTCPDYYGRTIDLRVIATEAHRLGMVLLVDEAHGAHFAAAPGMLPPTALSQGADIVAQSAHKTLPALTPSSLLHLSSESIADGRICPRHVAAMVRVFQTSSPSFMIAASIDLARAAMTREGTEPWRRIIELNRKLADALPPHYRRASPSGSDMSRLVVDYSQLGRSREELASALDRAHIDAELIDHRRIVFIPAIDQPEDDYDRLARALCSVRPVDNIALIESHARRLEELEKMRDTLFSARPLWQCTPRRALFGEMLSDEDQGDEMLKYATNVIAPYPPGMPIAWPGERIDERHAAYARRMEESGIAVRN